MDHFWYFSLTFVNSKCRIWIYQFWHFPQFFVQLKKVTCLVTQFDRKFQIFKKWQKWTIFGIFYYFLSTQNVKIARFARNFFFKLLDLILDLGIVRKRKKSINFFVLFFFLLAEWSDYPRENFGALFLLQRCGHFGYTTQSIATRCSAYAVVFTFH